MDKNQQRPKRRQQLPAKYQTASGEAEPPRKISQKQQKNPSREDMLLLLQSSIESSDPQMNIQFPPNPLIQNRSSSSNNPKPSPPLPIPIPTPTLQAPPPQQDSFSMTILLHLVQQLGQRFDMGLQQLEQKMNMGLQQLEQRVDMGLQQLQQNVDMGLQEIQQKVEMSTKQLEKKVEKITGMVRAEYLGQRPHWLPLDSQEDIQNFENCPDSDYHSVVGYLHQLGGHSLREAVRACFDDALSGTVALTHTWTGIRGTRPLYNTRIVRAIYEATLRSASYPKGTKADFADAGKAALKAAKQRTRPSASVPSADALAVTDARACWTGRDDDDDDDDDGDGDDNDNSNNNCNDDDDHNNRNGDVIDYVLDQNDDDAVFEYLRAENDDGIEYLEPEFNDM
ncbi:uncharacterized protein LOC143211209 [Lasioglossum baleicum]|uniref:uncharacterized protein LOC143211209 n=1 Tax=Lasioglossum baleicum TaxID=434251 RepID=UPI003FCD4855